MEEYLIHDNRRRPWKVSIDNKSNVVNIYGRLDGGEEGYATLPYRTIQASKVFVGESPHDETTAFSGGFGPAFKGNSILIQYVDGGADTAPPSTYLFIGSRIYSFTTTTPITFFSSPVGNNDVPYPYAVDEAGFTYLLIERVVLEPSTSKNRLLIEYPYSYYYQNQYIGVDRTAFKPEFKPDHKPFLDIKEMYVDDEVSDFGYGIDPEKAYDSLIGHSQCYGYPGNQLRHHECKAPHVVSMVSNDGTKQILDKTMYVSIVKQFGCVRGFSPISTLELDKK